MYVVIIGNMVKVVGPYKERDEAETVKEAMDVFGVYKDYSKTIAKVEYVITVEQARDIIRREDAKYG